MLIPSFTALASSVASGKATMSDYCYSDRLSDEYETHFNNPRPSGNTCYSKTFELSFLPPKRDSGTKCLSGAVAHFPKDTASVSDNQRPKPFFSEAL
jgi:hypothetical protein